jgi:HD-GYP domain-containing protein (c-di-GMP phosphodiesterase class II)
VETQRDAISTFPSTNELLDAGPFEAKLVILHRKIQSVLGDQALGRIAVAVYAKESGVISVYADSDVHGHPLRLYSAPLASVPSLAELAMSGQVRIVQDLFAMGPTPGPHTIAIRQNYRSSLTVPILKDGQFYGFVFLNAEQTDFFTYETVERVLPYAQLLTALAVADFDRINILKAAANTARDIGNLRDDETAGHLHRMTAYTRMIALGLAPEYGLSERWIDMLTHFAPLHDVGKINIPDTILFKPGKLTPDELVVMRNHVNIGVNIVKALLTNFAIRDEAFGTLLLNVVACHHETLDGLGYPNGIAGDALPLEGRIVAVADIFDALTSERPYKRAWSIDDALAHLHSLAGIKLDAACVATLIGSRDRIVAIKEQFKNEVPGEKIKAA